MQTFIKPPKNYKNIATRGLSNSAEFLGYLSQLKTTSKQVSLIIYKTKSKINQIKWE